MSIFLYGQRKNSTIKEFEKKIKVLFIESPDPSKPYQQQESIGVRYMNRFTIEEDDQFEIIAVCELKPDTINSPVILQEEINNASKVIQNRRLDGMLINPLHVILGSKNGYGDYIDELSRIFIQRFGYKSAMVSVLEMVKHDCITKERFDLEYGIANEDEGEIIDNPDRDDFSVGEDLETFIGRIKDGEIIEADYKESYLFRLLDRVERRKLDIKDAAFYHTFSGCHMFGSFYTTLENVDVPEAEWQKTEFKHLKFSRSKSSRVTYLIMDEDSEDSEIDENSDSPNYI